MFGYQTHFIEGDDPLVIGWGRWKTLHAPFAMLIDIFPAHGKSPLSQVDISQVFIQSFCSRIIGASYL
jgi:hypothetical protein